MKLSTPKILSLLKFIAKDLTLVKIIGDKYIAHAITLLPQEITDTFKRDVWINIYLSVDFINKTIKYGSDISDGRNNTYDYIGGSLLLDNETIDKFGQLVYLVNRDEIHKKIWDKIKEEKIEFFILSIPDYIK